MYRKKYSRTTIRFLSKLEQFNEENYVVRALKGSEVIVKEVRRSSFHVTQPLGLRNLGGGPVKGT